MKILEALKILNFLKSDEKVPVTKTIKVVRNTLTRTDGRTIISVKIDNNISDTFFVSFKDFYEAVKVMGDGGIKTTDDKVIVSNGDFTKEIKIIEDIRILNLPVELKYSVESNKLSEALKKASPAVAKDRSMKSLYGMLFSIEDFYLNVVAVDGFRLAVSKVVSGKSTAKDIFVSAEGIRALRRTLRRFRYSNYPVIFGESAGYGMIKFEDIKIVQKQDLEFPKYKRVIPEGSDITSRVAIPRESIMSFVEIATKISGDFIPLSFNAKDDTLTLGIKGTYKKFKAQTDGEIEILFNPRFVYEALKVFKHSIVIIKLVSPTKPALFYDGSVKDSYHLIMPIRPQSN